MHYCICKITISYANIAIYNYTPSLSLSLTNIINEPTNKIMHTNIAVSFTRDKNLNNIAEISVKNAENPIALSYE